MKLNCDLGESYGPWKMGQDEAVMPLIDMANIACGFHAGDPHVINHTLELAKAAKVEIGAHPSYPDTLGFGRRSMNCSYDEIVDLILYQVAAIDGMATTKGMSLSYVKPHGALYNDMMANEAVFKAVVDAINSYHKPLKLMVLATNSPALLDYAASQSVALIFEAFADRRYTPQGELMPRREPGAVLTKAEALAQVKQLITDSTVQASNGQMINIQADTLCVHGDNEQALALVKEIRALCQ
ncbi:5-oxoprolinase subunit PxpA [Paraferrimonas sp. SM1919]|uniref:5-oxoprolinase subunit PxpA n=1 Tax=Paraferrimonas sp. SM1919 TaxID=2662263 RepID=UPI0013D1292E|nr:5-oxoprolinase subunit PxpA [Paraferrimonas sp. SM1919]